MLVHDSNHLIRNNQVEDKEIEKGEKEEEKNKKKQKEKQKKKKKTSRTTGK